MQFGWAEIAQTVVAGLILFLLSKWVEALLKRRRDPTRQRLQQIADIKEMLGTYDAWESDKTAFALTQLKRLAGVMGTVSSISLAVIMAVAPILAMAVFGDFFPQRTYIMAAVMFLLLWGIGNGVIGFVTGRILTRIERIENYKKFRHTQTQYLERLEAETSERSPS